MLPALIHEIDETEQGYSRYVLEYELTNSESVI